MKVTTYSTNQTVEDVRVAVGQIANQIHWATIDLPLGSGVVLDWAVNAACKTVEWACDVADDIIGYEIEERYF